jgi:hypothetical protein
MPQAVSKSVSGTLVPIRPPRRPCPSRLPGASWSSRSKGWKSKQTSAGGRLRGGGLCSGNGLSRPLPHPG